MTLFDDASAVSVLCFIKTKDQTILVLKKRDVEMESVSSNRRQVRCIHMDDGRKYVYGDLKNLFTEKRIIPKYSLPYSVESNRRAERLNRTLLDKERALSNPLGTSQKHLWAEAVAAASYTGYMMLSKGCQRDNVTPIKVLTGIKPDVSHLNKFGCDAYVNIPRLFRDH